MSKVKKVLFPALLATCVLGVTGAVISAESLTAEAEVTNKGSINVSLTDNIVVNYYYDVTTSGDTHTAVFDNAQNSLDATVTGVKVAGSENTYKFTYDKITPQYLDTTFSIKVDGSTTVDAYSVTQYCEELQAKTAKELNISQNVYDKSFSLARDLVYYGQAAKAYKLGGEIIAGQGTLYKGEEHALDLSATPASGNKITGATVVFDSIPALKFTFQLIDKTDVTVFINGTQAELEGSGNIYAATYEGIYATKFDERVTVELKENGVTVQTLRYSVNDYATRTVVSASDDVSQEMKTLAKALWCYGAGADILYNNRVYTDNRDGTHSHSATVNDSSFKSGIENSVCDAMDVSAKSITNETGWTKLGSQYAYGVCSDENYIYALTWNKGSSRTIIRYNPTTNAIETICDLSSETIPEENAGLTYYNGQLYVFTDSGKGIKSFPTNFTEQSTWTDATLTFSDTPTIADAEYNAVQNKFAVITTGKKLSIYNEDGNLQNSITLPSKNNYHITTTDKYIYVNEVKNGDYTPKLYAYDWFGNSVGSVNISVDASSIGIKNSADTNVQGFTFFGGDLYYVVIGWTSQTHGSFIKVSGYDGYTVNHNTYVGTADYLAQQAASSTEAVTVDTTVSQAHAWTKFGKIYSYDICTDGKYIYGLTGDEAIGSNRAMGIYRFNPTDGTYVNGPTLTIYNKEALFNISYYEGKILVYSQTDSKFIAYETAGFGTESQPVEFTEFDAWGDWTNVAQVEYNALTHQYLVKKNNQLRIYENDKTTYITIDTGATSSVALRIATSNQYVFTHTTTTGQYAPTIIVYDWSGNKVGSVVIPNTTELMNFTSTGSCNVQGLTFYNGALYFSMTRWGSNAGGCIMKAQVADEFLTCYDCGGYTAELYAWEITEPTYTSEGLATNGFGDSIVLPKLNQTDYDYVETNGVATFTLRSENSIVIERAYDVNAITYIEKVAYNNVTANMLDDNLSVAITVDDAGVTSAVFTLSGDVNVASLGDANKSDNNSNVTIAGNGKLCVENGFAYAKNLTIADNATLEVTASANGIVEVTNLTIEANATLTVANTSIEKNKDLVLIYGNVTIAGNLNGSAVTAECAMLSFKQGGGTLELKSTAQVVSTNVNYLFGNWASGGKVTIIIPNGYTLASNKDVPTNDAGHTLITKDKGQTYAGSTGFIVQNSEE